MLEAYWIKNKGRVLVDVLNIVYVLLNFYCKVHSKPCYEKQDIKVFVPGVLWSNEHQLYTLYIPVNRNDTVVVLYLNSWFKT